MKLACAVSDTWGISLADASARIAAAGYTGAEVSAALLAGRGRADYGDALSALLKEHSLVLSGLRGPDMNATVDWNLCEPVSATREAMELASRAGGSNVVVRAGPRRSQPFDLLIQGISGAIRTAEQRGLTLNLANAYGTRLEQLEDVRAAMAELNHPRVRLVIDTGEFHRAAVNPAHVVTEFAGLADGIRITDRVGAKRVPIGKGEMNVPAILESACEAGFKAWLIAEPATESGDDWDAVLSCTRLYLQHVISLLA